MALRRGRGVEGVVAARGRGSSGAGPGRGWRATTDSPATEGRRRAGTEGAARAAAAV